MKGTLTILLSMSLGLGVFHAAVGSGICHKPACEPGYTIVEEIVYQEVCRDVCKVVPDVKKVKKWVYSTVPDPFCIKKSANCHGCGHKCCGDSCGGCDQCCGPYCRNLLVKKEVVEECPTTKCIIEKVVERIPCKVYRKVPCGTAPCGTAPSGTVPAVPPMPPAKATTEVETQQGQPLRLEPLTPSPAAAAPLPSDGRVR